MPCSTRWSANYPSSKWITEAQFRRGEILFSEGRYGDSERAYAAVVAAGPGSGYYEQGLYKQGWSLFKQGRGEESVDSFLKVIDLVMVDNGKLRDARRARATGARTDRRCLPRRRHHLL